MTTLEEQSKHEQKETKKVERKDERKEDKKEERRFAALPPSSVIAMAETVGIEGLHGDIPRLLAEDATYRLRALLQDACQLMRHARRKRLTTEDMNIALRHMDVPLIYGHGSPDSSTWRQVKDPVNKDAELSFPEDAEVNLSNMACNNLVPLDLGVTTVTANWLVIEGNPRTTGFTQNSGSTTPARPVNEDLTRYYDHVTSAIVSGDAELTKIALNDVRSNAGLAGLVPHLVQFVAAQIRIQNQTSGQMKLLFLLQALLDNPSLFLRPTPIAESMCESALYSLLEDNSNPQHWILRDYAARLLANICRLWGDGGLTEKQVEQLMEVVSDTTRCLTAQYGAVTALACLGAQVLEKTLLAQLTSYWHHVRRHLQAAYPTATQQQAQHVRGALIKACGVYLTHHTINNTGFSKTKSETSSESISQPHGSLIKVKEEPLSPKSQSEQVNGKTHFCQMYADMLDCFGDSLLCVTPALDKIPLNWPRSQKYVKAEMTVSLGDKDSHRTGEEMLQEFLQDKTEALIKQEPKEMDLPPLFSPIPVQSTHIHPFLTASKSAHDPFMSSHRPAKRSREDSSGGSRTKKQRRSGGGKPRLSDVFDLNLRKKSQSGITLSVLGRSHDSHKGHHKTPKKVKSASGGNISSKIKTPSLSVYRTCCAKLKPYGKRKIGSKSRDSTTICTSGDIML